MFCTFYHAKRTYDKLLEDVKLLDEFRDFLLLKLMTA